MHLEIPQLKSMGNTHLAVSLQLSPKHPACYIASVCGGLTVLLQPFSPTPCKVHPCYQIPQLKYNGKCCISKNKPLNPFCLSLWRPDLAIAGEKSRPLQKNSGPRAKELVVGDYMHLEIPQLKLMGNTPFVRFSAIKPQTPSPVILHQFVAA